MVKFVFLFGQLKPKVSHITINGNEGCQGYHTFIGFKHLHTSMCFDKKRYEMKTLNYLITLLIISGTAALHAQSANDLTMEKPSKFSFEKTVEAVKSAAQEAGWSIPTEHDMQMSMKKAGKDVKPARIIVLCNADHAYQILNNDENKHFLSMMPCRIAIYEKNDGKTYLSIMNLSLINSSDQELQDLMKNVQTDIEQMLNGIIEE